MLGWQAVHTFLRRGLGVVGSVAEEVNVRSFIFFVCVWAIQFNYTHAASWLFIITLIHFNIHFSWLNIEKIHVLFEQLHIYDALLVCKAGDSTVNVLNNTQRRWALIQLLAQGRGASELLRIERHLTDMRWGQGKGDKTGQEWGNWGSGARWDKWDWQCICPCSVLSW